MEFKLTKKNLAEYSLFLIPALLLAPILLFQISNDISIYITAGKIISNGGKIYADYVDLKPPLFYYLYTVIYKLTGGTEFNIRIFDYIWQIITCWLIFKVSYKLFKNKVISHSSSAIYSITYTCLGSLQTMNPESFAGLFILLFMMIEIHEPKVAVNRNAISIYCNFRLITQGILAGILISIKFTFGFILFGLLMSDIINNKINIKYLLKKYSILSFTSLIILLLTFVQLLDPGIYAGFKNVLLFLNFYSSQPPFSNLFIKILLKDLAYLFSDNYSLLLSVIICIGMFKILISQKSSYDKNSMFLLTVTFSILLSFIIEKKITIVHFHRNYALFAIVSGYGIFCVYKDIMAVIKNRKKLLIFFIPLCFIVILLSPVTRYFNLLVPPYLYFFDNEKYNYIRNHAVEGADLMITNREIASYMNKKAIGNEHIIVMAIGGNTINYLLNSGIKSKFSQSCFYFSNIKIPSWENEILSEIKTADYIIINYDDRHLILTGNNLSTYEKLKNNKAMFEYLTDNFYIDNEFPPYFIYKRKLK